MSSQPDFSDTHTVILYQWGLLLCAMTYGAHIILSASSIRPLINRRNQCLLIYIILLFIVSTVGFGIQAWWTQVVFIENVGYPGGPNQFLLDNMHSAPNKAVTAIYIVLNMLSDGIILFRFYTLCGVILARNRLWALVFVVPSSIALIITAGTCFPQIAGLGVNLWTGISIGPGIAYMALSLSINTILTMLIIGRLLFLRRQISRTFGPASSEIYTSVVALLIESASLYTIVALMTVIACGVGSPMQHVLLPMLGQLQAIPPLLITSRLAAGRALNKEEYSKLSTRMSSPRSLTKKLSAALKSKTSVIFTESNKCRSFLKVDIDVPRDTGAPSTASTSGSTRSGLPSYLGSALPYLGNEKLPYELDCNLPEPEKAYQFV
ncbi:hypothetical protein PHLGIDRAFT_125269 [Phlebiopsis gigantea 11061_1 CR5-6]|uniref:Uncharacterized protein n=1 Tax=Phlebiopsis gigantea (strain 11061_1 CR5-6) TaxID=745531 RepID=A0A0C3S4M6_PHLG1|nr:hypothetical protein PHLGIDRAFT_125269 [Phlebiopsis gigantea 11061_1 CR5-6]